MCWTAGPARWAWAAARLSIKEARLRARQCRQLLVDGIDPIEQRKARRDEKRAAEAKRITFTEATERYISAHAVKWTNAKHAAQWRASVEQYAYPVIGTLPIDAIDLQHVLKVLEPIWLDKNATARRLRGRVEKVLAWATVRKFRNGENPARWSGHLSEMLPEPKNGKHHHAALAIDALPAFMEELRAVSGVTARALEFTILTAARTGEVNGATWDEIEGNVWTVPPDRMKARKAHRVPLSGRALEILEEVRAQGGSFVFPGVQSQKLRHSAMLELLKTMRPGLTVHGLRSTFSDWARDSTAYARDVIETCLAHQIEDLSEAAYRRGDALEKRAKLMEAWARYCASPAPPATVTTLLRA